MRKYYDLVFIKNKNVIHKIIAEKGYAQVIAPVDLSPLAIPFSFKETSKKAIRACNPESYATTRKQIEKGKCDVLLNPSKIFLQHPLDYVIIKIAGENNVVFAFTLTDLLSLKKKELLLKYINKTSKIIELAKKYDTKIIVSSGAKRYNQVRYSRDLAALYYLFDEDLKQSIKAISENYEFLINKLKIRYERIAPGIYEG